MYRQILNQELLWYYENVYMNVPIYLIHYYFQSLKETFLQHFVLAFGTLVHSRCDLTNPL